jgi:hypothetical protein
LCCAYGTLAQVTASLLYFKYSSSKLNVLSSVFVMLHYLYFVPPLLKMNFFYGVIFD